MKNKQMTKNQFNLSFSRKIITLIIIFCSCFLSFNVTAQTNTITISGVVTDNKEEPLTGVTVKVEDGNKVTMTDVTGRFKIEDVSSNARLTVSSMGFITTRLNVNGRTTINIVLEEDTRRVLDEVVVIGYGSMRKRDISGAISSVSAEAIETQSPVSVMDALQGQVAGVEIVTGSGAPGDASNVRVRGTATFEGGASPLYVVDGVIYEDIDDINPDDIQSIEVLKDAASAAIYGSRSANGVFLITTKQGEATKNRFSIRYLRSYSELSRKMPKANGADRKYYDAMRREISSYRNDQTYGYTVIDTLAYLNNQDIDLQDLIFRMAVRDEISLTLNGSSNVFKYYMNIGFLNEDGIIVNSSQNRLTSRINTEYLPNDKLKVGSKIFMSISSRDGISEDGVLNQLLERIPYWAVTNPDGSYVPNITNRRNPYAVAMTDVSKEQRYSLTSYQYLNYKITSDLSFNTNIQGNFNLNRIERFRPQPQLNSTEVTTGRDYTSLKYNWTNENYFSYNKAFGRDHELDLMAGASFQGWNTETIRLVGLNYTTDEIYSLNAASGFDAGETYTYFSEHRMASFFGRTSYNYKRRYLFNGNLRYDGSSRFGKNNRWGLFPSASAAWRFSDESFTEFMKPFVDDAKLRVSYGVTGNEQIGDYVSLLLYAPNYIYDNVAGIAPTNLAYNDLSWETTKQFNVGLDLSFLKNRLRIVADYYKKNTDGLLNRVELPKETGFKTTYKNVGSMSNEGVELSIGYNIIQKRNFKWSVDANWAFNNSRITKLADGIPFYKGSEDAIYVQEGSRLGEFYGYKYLGIFAYDESNAFSANWEQLTPVFDGNGSFSHYTLGGATYNGTVQQRLASNGDVLLGGDVNFEDSNKDGRVDVLDKDYIGCAQPDFFGGINTTLSYKRFTLFLSFYYSIGGDIYNYSEARRNKFRWDGATPSPQAIHNMWTHQGDEALYPAPIVSEHNMLAPSDFYLEDASYIKLKNVKLTYDLPWKIIKKLHLKSVSMNIYGKNLLTFTDYTGYDPEFSSVSDPLVMGIDTNRYPRKREFGFGVNVGF